MAGRRQRASRPPHPTPLKISRKTRLRLNHQAVCAGLSIFPRLWGIKREEDQVEDSCCAATAAKRAAMQQEMKSWTFQTWNLFLSTQAWFCCLGNIIILKTLNYPRNGAFYISNVLQLAMWLQLLHTPRPMYKVPTLAYACTGNLTDH